MILEIILLPRIKNECFIWNNFGVENTLRLEVFSLIKDIKKIIISKNKKIIEIDLYKELIVRNLKFIFSSIK